ncbi:hypothetical protein [Halorussus sp. MSC15.2]|uniref:hypothetical protein n=1 Tax=Halorussus sp. MSC15.2 TaxID=2283638 RepID=UPI0013D7EA65|nr:hypothetical protein [Halorussus sp. MSC15.2]NEU59181.1 hypothetical protein [Halorussus sp. MSC15.2]
MTVSIALRFNEPIEDVAGWPWKKRYAYAIALSEHQRAQREAQQAAQNVGARSAGGDVPTPPSNAPRGVHPSVAKHEHVVRVKDD